MKLRPSFLANKRPSSVETCLYSSRSVLLPTNSTCIEALPLALTSSSHYWRCSKVYRLRLWNGTWWCHKRERLRWRCDSRSGWWTWSSPVRQCPISVVWGSSCWSWWFWLRTKLRWWHRVLSSFSVRRTAELRMTCPHLNIFSGTCVPNDDEFEQIMETHLIYIKDLVHSFYSTSSPHSSDLLFDHDMISNRQIQL